MIILMLIFGIIPLAMLGVFLWVVWHFGRFIIVPIFKFALIGFLFLCVILVAFSG